MSAPTSQQDVTSFYQARLADLGHQEIALRRDERRYSRWRLIAFAGIALFVAIQAGYFPTGIGMGLCGMIFVAFVVVLMRQERLQESLVRVETLQTYNQQRLARLARDWSQIPALPSESKGGATPPMAIDLDLFSDRGLMQLIAETATPQGRMELRRWFLEPADPDEVVQRQAGVQALSPRWELREEVAVRGRVLQRHGAATDRLAEWGVGPAHMAERPWVRWGSVGGPILLLVSLLLVATGVLPEMWLLASVVAVALNVLFSVLFLAPIHDIFNSVTTGRRQIDHYRTLFQAVWNLPADVPAFARMRTGLSTDGVDFEHALGQLYRYVQLGSGRRSGIWFPLYMVAQFTLLWDFHVMRWLEHWQQQHGRALKSWFRSVGELEAYCSLAALAHDHPDWVYPKLAKQAVRGSLTCQRLGHPLLAAQACVRNDVTIGPSGRLLLVTGSNMSGKSTLLRAIGINTVLSQAGSVVCAESMSLTPMQIATSMRVHDSLADGVSFFLAELQRLKVIVDESRELARTGDRCMLFLLDEILQGTNSRERQVAVERILGHLLDSGATGAVSTHDLELAQSPVLSPRSHTVHFRESFRNVHAGDGGTRDSEVMVFDYLLRDGICPTTNALKLLSFVGLD